MKCLPDTSTHDQQCESSPIFLTHVFTRRSTLQCTLMLLSFQGIVKFAFKFCCGMTR